MNQCIFKKHKTKNSNNKTLCDQVGYILRMKGWFNIRNIY